MKYKLIALDMDGTLLNSRNEISKRNVQAIHKAIDKGIYVILATGRMPASARYYAQTIGLDNPIISCNGAIIFNNDIKQIIYEEKLQSQAIGQILDLVHEYRINYRFCGIDTFYGKVYSGNMEEFYPNYREDFSQQGIKVELLDDTMEYIENNQLGIHKFEFVEEDMDKLLDFRKELEAVKGISMASSWHNNVEIVSAGVSKGKSLQYLCEKSEIKDSQIIAMGDNENDISMFQVAGLAIAMENGDKTAKDHADIIAPTNDRDGVARLIEKYI